MTRHRAKTGSLGATVLSVLLAASCSGGSGEPDAQSPTADPDSPPPAVRILADCHEERCEGQLLTGTYRSAFFEPTIDFEIASPGWTWLYAGNFAMLADPSHEDLYAADGIYFLRDPAIASQDCEETEEPGVGRSVRDLVAWLESAPGLDVSDPLPVTVGGLEGMQLDIELDPTWKRTCFFSEGLPAVPLIFNGRAIGGYNWTALPDQTMRWFVLGSEDGVIIVDVEDGPGGVSREDLFQTGTEIVDTLAFSPPS